MREARRAVELAAAFSPGHQTGMRELAVYVYVAVGDHGSAIGELEALLAIPSWISVPALRTDPAWDPLRGDPRFQRLVAGK